VEGTSLESQRLSCEEFARAKHIHVLRVFVEEGESAKFADRTELLALIDFCKEHKGQVNMLIVWKVDRFARNVVDHFNVKATLQKYGVDIVSVTEPIDAKPEGRLMETILAGFAQFDNDIRAARTVQGMRRKIQEGIFPWKPPLGYRSSRTGREKKNTPDVPDQPLFGILQKAWQEFGTGIYTKAEMRRLLERRGVTRRNGLRLPSQSIDNLFRNPYYAGILVDPWSGEEYAGRHLPMVSAAEFARVQDVVLRRNRAIPHHRNREEFPLRGLARCPECRAYLTASFSRGRSKRYPYYHCHNSQCARRGKAVRAEDAHDEFTKYLPVIAPKPELVDRLLEKVAQTAKDRERQAASHRNQMKDLAKQFDRELQELIHMRSQRLISDEEFAASKAALLEKREAVQAGPTHPRLTAAEVRNKLAEIAAPLYNLPGTWKSIAPAVRARFQRLIFPVGFVIGLIRTAELGLLFRIIGDSTLGNPHVVPRDEETWNQIYQEIQEFASVMRGEEEPKSASGKRVRRRSKRIDSPW
jgi:site-specific DNA recombinase